MKRTLLALTAALSCLVLQSAEGATVLLRNTDGPGEGFNDPTPIAAVGGNPATTRGQARRNAVDEALKIWGALLQSSQTIIVDAAFDPQQCTPDFGTLGSASPTNYYRDFAGAPKTNTWYPSALADALASANVSEKFPSTAGLADVTARFNSNVDTAGCLRGRGFYYGIDGKPGKQTHFLEVALHEIGHGLGFASIVNPKTGVSYATSTDGIERLSIYDHFIFDEFLVKPWTELSPTQRAISAVRRGQVTWSGANANARTNRLSAGFNSLFHLQLYSPLPVAPGSSISHWDTSATADLLMEPFETAVINQTTDLTVCALRDLGWKTTKCPDPLTNALPSVTSFSLSVTEDTPKVFSLTVKDDDLDPLTAAFPTSPSRGTLSQQAASASSPIEYRPNPNANGSDSFTVVVNDGIGPSAAATVNVTIAPVNDAPTGKPLNATVQSSGQVSITLAGSDVDGDALTYAVVSQPGKGTLTGTPPNLLYRANASFSGTDSFTYTVSDASLASSPAAVTINAAAPPPPSGGGGAFGLPSVLLLLVALGLDTRGRARRWISALWRTALRRARKQAPRVLALGVLVALVTACGGSNGPTPPNPPPTPPPTPTPTPPQPPTPPAPKPTVQQSASYAEVVRLSLLGLGLPSSLSATQLSVKSGTADNLTIRDGEIRFITPSDPGTDQIVELKALVDNEELVIPVVIQSYRPTEVFSDIEASESAAESTAPPPKLTVTGLGPGNALVGGALVFSVANTSPLDPVASAATIYVPSADQIVDLARQWAYNSTTRALTVSSSAMTTLLASMPSEDVEVSVSLVSPDGEFSSAYVFAAHKPRAVIAGQLRDLGGAPVTTMTNTKIAARGLDNRTAKVALVDAAGRFQITGLVDGTYEVAVLSVEQPGFVTATVPIYSSTTTANVDLTLAPPPLPAAVIGGAAPAMLVASDAPGSVIVVAADVAQDGIPPPSRGPAPPVAMMQALSAMPADCGTAGPTGETTYTVSAAAQDSTIACLVAHNVPKGTAKLGIRLTVATQEYPVYTQSKSKYNDSWSYSLAGIPGAVSAGGQVNDTHYTTGVINRDICADVTSLAAANAFVMNARIAATNIGDSVLPTQVTLRVSTTCTGGLKVTQATMTSPNTKPYLVVGINGGGNLANNYVSLPITSDFADWGVPLEVRYDPPAASITKVRLGLLINGQPTLSDFNLLEQATTTTPGRLVFANLKIPRFPIALFSGKTNVLVELTGSLDGASVVSKPEDGSVLFAGKRAFVPLFLAGDQLGSSRRYGGRDAGGDSWAASTTIAWLQGKAYRFDDVSALHAARFSTGTACPSMPSDQREAGDSVLCHKGHSDGRQVDLRYADGSGGYTDALGGKDHGAAIKTLLNAALAETSLAPAAPKPNLAAAKNWILANRAIAELEAAKARKIHVGPSWMKLALMDGKFPNGTAIPGVSAWTTKPGVVSFVEKHLNHWHISLKE